MLNKSKIIYIFILSLYTIILSSEIKYQIPNSLTCFKNSSLSAAPAKPQLPVKQLTFLLPPNADFSTIKVELINKKDIIKEGSFNIEPAPLERSDNEIFIPKNAKIVENKDINIYQKNSFYPKDYIGEFSAGFYRDYKILRINIYLSKYNPITNKIKYFTDGELSIKYSCSEKNRRKSKGPIPNRVTNNIKRMVENFDSISPTYRSYPLKRADASAKYVIITTPAISAAVEPELTEFINSKEARGFSVELVTNWGGGSGQVAAENLRNWLLDNYETKAIEYLLIIGDPTPSSGDIAMKITYPYKETPTDLYFADLSSNYDKNGNGKCGEEADLGTGGIDHTSEVIVGRIPVYNSNYTDLKSILKKTVKYEQETSKESAWRKKMLLCMLGYSANEGYKVGDAIKNSIEDNSSEWDFYRIYNSQTGSDRPDVLGVSEYNLLNGLTLSDYGIVEWLTHGKEDAALNVMSSSSVMSSTPQTGWDNSKPAFVFCGSCLNATPSVSDNLTYSLLKNGAIGAVGATQTSIYLTGTQDFTNSYYNSGFIYQFGNRMALENCSAAEALAYNKDNVLASPSSLSRQNYFAFNLYGDPSVGIATTDANTAIDNINKIEKMQENLSYTVKNSTINFNFNLNNKSEVLISIYSVNGKLIKSVIKNMNSGFQSMKINLSNQNSGIYILRYSFEKVMGSKKIIISK